MVWNIDKQFDFCYGHRVWSQELEDASFCVSTCCKCRHLHGHQGMIKISLSSDVLKNGMVTDFHNLNWFKKWVDDVLDHKFIIDKNDPLFETLSGIKPDEFTNINKIPEGYWLMNKQGDTSALSELFESFVIVDFVPTSENLSAWIFKMATDKMDGLGIDVSYVDFWETPKSHCRVEK